MRIKCNICRTMFKPYREIKVEGRTVYLSHRKLEYANNAYAYVWLCPNNCEGATYRLSDIESYIEKETQQARNTEEKRRQALIIHI